MSYNGDLEFTDGLRENAEGMLLLRSYLKAGRFDDIIDWSIAKAADWWPCGQDAVPPIVEAIRGA